MTVVIVESPAKAKTINKYLGTGYTVLASYGHVRDLPAKDGSVRPDEDFAMEWEADPKSAKRLKDIADAVKADDRLVLATDPDREGEAISWHVLEVLKKRGALKGKEVQRVVFNQITKSAVTEAMRNPRQVDQELVDAYLARRALDYLVGFTLSPVLWRKLPGARSAGRVQSVALRLVVDREMEIERFVAREYWSVTVDAKAPDGSPFQARLHSLDGKTLKKFDLENETAAARAVKAIEAGRFSVSEVESKPVRRNPSPPFTTSTLQQEASRKLGFNAKRTMQVAQQLYEGVEIGGETVGLITYMRTDGMDLAPEALRDIRATVAKRFGDRYLPDSPRVYKSKAKNAQEAHEAIRPTDPARAPETLRLSGDLARLYELIWKRTVACQMEAAVMERTTVDIAADGVGLRATGSVVTFDGFLKLYEEGRDDTADDEDGKLLPKLAKGDAVAVEKITPNQHFTEPPPRFTEATLVKRMEELGIGRPSTYASVLSVLRDRNYVRMEKNRFVPEDKGRIVTHFLEHFFTRYVEYDFTADLEEKLDLVSDGKVSWKELLRDFWRDFIASIDDIKDLRVGEVLEKLNEVLEPHFFPQKEGEDGDPRACPACADGRLSLKLGKFGAFIGCSNYPECRYTRQLAANGNGEEAADEGPKLLGEDEDGTPITLRSGRFGPYVQRGDGGEGEKPPRASVPKDVPLERVDLEFALRLLSLPRPVGLHPETGEPINAGIGRYGPYVQHGRTYANLPSTDDVFTIGLNHAVSLIAEKQNKGGRGTPAALKTLGEHPDGGAVELRDGRYGPYVSHGKVNATLPRGLDKDEITLERALELLAAKAAAKGGKAKTAAKKPPAKKAAPKKAGAKKTAKSTAAG